MRFSRGVLMVYWLASTALAVAADIADAPQALRELQSAYRAGPIAERVRITARNADDDASSTITLRLDAGSPAEQRPRRFRIDAGPLTLALERDRLVVVSALNNEEYYEAALEARALPEQLAERLPPIPLPQLGWAFRHADPGRTPSGHVREQLVGIGEAVWSRVESGAGAVRILGTCNMADAEMTIGTPDVPGIASVLGTRHAPDALPTLKSLTATGASGVTVHLSCERADAGTPASWMPDLAGRRRVDAITMLRPRAGDVRLGERIPALALMNSELAGWPLSDHLRAMEGDDGQLRRVGAAIVLYDSSRQDVLGAAKSGLLAAASVSREYVLAELAGKVSAPRLLVRAVGLMELGEIGPQRVAQMREDWQTLLGPAEAHNVGGVSWREPLWSSSGRETLERIIPGTSVAVVVIDAQQKLLAAIPLEGKAIDETVLAARIKAVFESQER